MQLHLRGGLRLRSLPACVLSLTLPFGRCSCHHTVRHFGLHLLHSQDHDTPCNRAVPFSPWYSEGFSNSVMLVDWRSVAERDCHGRAAPVEGPPVLRLLAQTAPANSKRAPSRVRAGPVQGFHRALTVFRRAMAGEPPTRARGRSRASERAFSSVCVFRGVVASEPPSRGAGGGPPRERISRVYSLPECGRPEAVAFAVFRW